MEKKWPVALLAARIGRGRLLKCGIFSEEDFFFEEEEDFGQVFVQFADRDGSLRIIAAFPIPFTGTM